MVVEVLGSIPGKLGRGQFVYEVLVPGLDFFPCPFPLMLGRPLHCPPTSNSLQCEEVYLVSTKIGLESRCLTISKLFNFSKFQFAQLSSGEDHHYVTERL